MGQYRQELIFASVGLPQRLGLTASDSSISLRSVTSMLIPTQRDGSPASSKTFPRA